MNRFLPGSWKNGRRAARGRRLRGLLQTLGCIALVWLRPVQAEIKLIPHALAQYTYNSNVYNYSSKEQAAAQSGDNDSTMADSYLQYTGGFDVIGAWGPQKLTTIAEYNGYLYDHFTRLNHHGYSLSSLFDWKLNHAVDGTLSYQQIRAQAPFADLATTQLVINTEKTAKASANVLLNPDWKVLSAAKYYKLDSPIPQTTDGEPINTGAFGLEETSGMLGLRYLGIARLSAGLEADYDYGKYTGVVPTPENDSTTAAFHQVTLALTSNYVVSGLTSINAQLGYTKRKGQAGANTSASGLTGTLGYARTLSVKTAVDVEIYRNIASYDTSANTEIITGAGGGFTWKPTVKVEVATRYNYTINDFQGQPNQTTTTTTGSRTDHIHNATVAMLYTPVHWLIIRPFASYTMRGSNEADVEYHASTIGIEARARFE